MENYTYKLEYIDGQTKVTMTFPADIDIWDLATKIREFLSACSWDGELLDRVLITEDE